MLDASFVDRPPLTAGLAALETVAPQVHSALVAVCDAVLVGVDAELLTATRNRVEVGLGAANEPVAEPTSRLAVAAAPLTDQFVIYVPGVNAAMLEPLGAELGDKGLEAFIQALYVLDQTTRLRLIYAQLFADERTRIVEVAQGGPATPVAQSLARLHAETMLLSSLDILTSEIVRLRAGSYHHCRLCTSIRLQNGGVSVVNEDLASKIERNDLSDMSVEQRLAVQYADAHMTNPKAIDQDLISELNQRYSRAQLVELSLDVSQWNQQKILVALGTDTPVSEAGLTPLIFDAEGHIVHGAYGSLG